MTVHITSSDGSDDVLPAVDAYTEGYNCSVDWKGKGPARKW